LNVEHADPDEQSAQGHRGWIIDSQDGNGRTADWRATEEHRILPLEMFSSHISPWMEQPDDLTNYRVNAGQVCALVAVAVDAAQRKVLALGWAAVLLSDDVVDLKIEAGETLREMAVLTSKPSSLTNEFNELPLHVMSRSGVLRFERK